MSATYLMLAGFAQKWGLVYFVVVFAVVVTYALWPASKERFDEAARMPLRED